MDVLTAPPTDPESSKCWCGRRSFALGICEQHLADMETDLDNYLHTHGLDG
jgi:hypothetical protein